MKAEIASKVEELPEFEDSKRLYVNGTEQKDFKPVTMKKEDAEREDVDRNEAVSIVSRNYTLVQHEEAFSPLLERLPEELEGEVLRTETGNWAGMRLFPRGQDIGIWRINSVDSRTSLTTRFLQRTKEGSVFIPKNVAGYSKIHRGEVTEELEDFDKVISDVRGTWSTIVEKLSKVPVDRDDLLPEEEREEEEDGEIHAIVGPKASEKILDWVKQTTLYDWADERKAPSLWDVILRSIRIVSDRSFASEVHREERLQRLSSALLAYSLKLA